MISAAAREIRDGELVFVGMRLPLLAFNLAKSIWAPNAIGIFEAGLLRENVCLEYIHTMCDLPLQTGASWLTGLLEVMSCLQRGEVDLGIIGGAQVDSSGNVNSTLVKTVEGARRLPGSGGACDIAVLSKRLVVVMPLEARRIRRRVDYITSPCGAEEVTLVTDKALFKKGRGDERLRVVGIYKGVEPGDVLREAGEMVSKEELEEVEEVKPPTEEELRVLRRLDKEGFWTRRRG
ncbi:MAG TPA: CoA transferase [Aigarchaeota archaeon]|nr:CoA transferase [Aigarchaeota archaeon]